MQTRVRAWVISALAEYAEATLADFGEGAWSCNPGPLSRRALQEAVGTISEIRKLLIRPHGRFITLEVEE